MPFMYRMYVKSTRREKQGLRGMDNFMVTNLMKGQILGVAIDDIDNFSMGYSNLFRRRHNLGICFMNFYIQGMEDEVGFTVYYFLWEGVAPFLPFLERLQRYIHIVRPLNLHKR